MMGLYFGCGDENPDAKDKTMKDPLMMTDSERNAELAIVQKFAQVVLYATLGFAALFVVFGAVATMMTK
jgi:hypothetical protein